MLKGGENKAIHRSNGNNALDKHLHKSVYIPFYPVYKWQRGAVVAVLNTHISDVKSLEGGGEAEDKTNC